MTFRPARQGLASRQPSPWRKGAHAVEFAAVAPWLFLILLGIFEIGRGLMVTELLAAGARAGARVGVVPGKSSSDVQTATNNFLTSVGVKGDNATVYVNDVAVSGTGTDPLTNASSGTEVTVKVTVPVSKITWVPAGSFLTGSLSGQFTMRRE